MKRLLQTVAAAAMSVLLHAQGGMNEVLASIEENNTTLKALREMAGAQKLENRADLLPADPEVGFNYLWGSPSAIGNRRDISVNQSFDIATLSGAKGKVTAKKNELLDWQYRADRMNLLLEAKQYCIDLIYYNALLKELHTRMDNARSIEAAQKRRLDDGDISLPEYNSARLNAASVGAEVARAAAEREAVAAQLARLNGGLPVKLAATEYEAVLLPTDFSEWCRAAEAKNPVLAYVGGDVELSHRQLAVSRQMGLPSFSAGYMSEKTSGEHFRGLTLGVSVPLWSNRNRMKQARAEIRAAELRRADARQQFYGNLETLFRRTQGLRAAADVYRASLLDADNTALLKTALEAGEISVVEYFTQLAVYYEVVDRALDTEREYQKSLAELSAMEL